MPRSLSTDSMTLHSTSQYDQMDPEVRAQILSNIQVIYGPSAAAQIHIATCRSIDGSFMAFLVMHSIVKSVWNPNLLAGEARNTRSAALMSLLESTEDRIRDMLLKNNNKQDSKRQTTQNAPSSKEKKVIPMPKDENMSVDYGEKPKEKGFLSWRKTHKPESIYGSST